jgi:hypothetical protein
MPGVSEDLRMSEQSIYRCEHCKGVLGVTDGLTLIIGLVRLIHATKLRCGACERLTTWRPSAQRADKERVAAGVGV